MRGTSDLSLNRWLPGRADWEWQIVEGVTRDIVQKLELGRGSGPLVEVGCGNGLVLSALTDNVSTAVGVDFSHGMLARARQRLHGRASLCQAMADGLPFPDGAFPRTLCYNVFPNFPDPGYGRRVIAELVRVTRSGGMVLIGGIPNEVRKREWAEAAGQFWRERQTPMRRAFQSLCGRPRAFLADYWVALGNTWARMRGRPPRRITFLYYRDHYFADALQGSPHTCEVLPSYFPFQPVVGGPECRDYRLDVRILVR